MSARLPPLRRWIIHRGGEELHVGAARLLGSNANGIVQSHAHPLLLADRGKQRAYRCGNFFGDQAE